MATEMMRTRDGLTFAIEEMAYHRNGVCGAPFYVITFRHRVEGETATRNMIAIVFQPLGACAVLDRDALGRGEIAFGGIDGGLNSWRGDRFELALRAQITIDRGDEAWEASQ
jgi:hypothetical protein